MRPPEAFAAFLLVISCTLAAGKGKEEVLLPADVLQAETVLVVIDPAAGVTPDAPLANQAARDDVEKALMKWGRFRLAIDSSTADLILTVRKGNGEIAQETIGGMPTNNRPVIFQPTDSGIRLGGSQKASPMAGDPGRTQLPEPHPRLEVGAAQDTLVVYRGKRSDAFGFPPVWTYSAKNALKSPKVPAVEEFRKLIAEAEKQQANRH